MKIKCCLCGKVVEERESHNAEPLMKGRCCCSCNKYKVVPYRISLPLSDPWYNNSVKEGVNHD